LAEKFCPDANDETLLHDHAVCLCDDDNDIEMARACRHAYIPQITSENMAALIEKHPEHFTLTGEPGLAKTGPAASEEALSLILEQLHDDPAAEDSADILEDLE
jgi:hypothetical protein